MRCTGKCEQGQIEQRLVDIDEIIRAGYDRGIALTPDRIRELMREEDELKAKRYTIRCDQSSNCQRNLYKLRPDEFGKSRGYRLFFRPKPMRGFIPRGAWLN